ncbi:MAG: hypothetical protein ACRCXT_12415 [Paraclostridium sp.]
MRVNKKQKSVILAGLELNKQRLQAEIDSLQAELKETLDTITKLNNENTEQGEQE